MVLAVTLICVAAAVPPVPSVQLTIVKGPQAFVNTVNSGSDKLVLVKLMSKVAAVASVVIVYQTVSFGRS